MEILYTITNSNYKPKPYNDGLFLKFKTKPYSCSQ